MCAPSCMLPVRGVAGHSEYERSGRPALPLQAQARMCGFQGITGGSGAHRVCVEGEGPLALAGLREDVGGVEGVRRRVAVHHDVAIIWDI